MSDSQLNLMLERTERMEHWSSSITLSFKSSARVTWEGGVASKLPDLILTNQGFGGVVSKVQLTKRAEPLPDRASPLTSSRDAPSPIPRENTRPWEAFFATIFTLSSGLESGEIC